MWQLAETDEEKGLARLAIGAFFFAMRSCEYLAVSGTRLTKLLLVENIRFIHDGTFLDHASPSLPLATCVSITFVAQKNGAKFVPITMYRTGDELLCPVRAWAGIIQKIRSDPDGRLPSTSVNFCRVGASSSRAGPRSHVAFLSGAAMISLIRKAGHSIGAAKLGFDPSRLGTHSIRSGAAMAMHLANVPVYTIMLIGRWSSDAFLRYIKVQVQEFAQNVSGRMILNQDFYSVPDYNPHMHANDSSQVARSAPNAPPSRACGRVLSGAGQSLGRGAIRTAFCLLT
jgi:hypothetical protein